MMNGKLIVNPNMLTRLVNYVQKRLSWRGKHLTSTSPNPVNLKSDLTGQKPIDKLEKKVYTMNFTITKVANGFTATTNTGKNARPAYDALGYPIPATSNLYVFSNEKDLFAHLTTQFAQ